MSRLFAPIQIGNLTLRNRIVMPAMHLNFSTDSMVNEKVKVFYRLRSEGGAGLLQIGPCPINKEAGGEFMLGIDDDKYVPGLKELSQTIHDAGAKCGIQLYHAGRYTYSFFIEGKQPPSASATVSGLTHEQSREMTLDEIKATIQDFATCAERVKRAGFDTVEVIGSAGYLINQFLSPLTNLRTDEYGGSFENRARFGVEVVQEVRKLVGPDFPISVRLSGNDFVPGSNSAKEKGDFAKLLVDAGANMFNVTGGWHETRVPQITNALPRGGFSYLARLIKSATGVPVAAANRINTPEMAEHILEDGMADMVSLGRALIVDADWPKKAQDGRWNDILQCIACNQRCLDNVFQLKPVSCLVNPRVGREEDQDAPRTEPKQVLVVGGGPAGLEAAATAALRGHKVTVLEEDTQLGGQIPSASRAPNKDEFMNIIPMLARQAELAGAIIETGIEVTPEEVSKRKPDVLVIATGAKPFAPPIEGLGHPKVKDAVSFLENMQTPGDNVVVIGGGPIGVEASLYCAEFGTISPDMAAFLLKHDAEPPERIRELLWKGHKQVTIIEMLPRIGNAIGKSTKWVALKEIQETGVRVLTKTKALRIDDEGVHVEIDGKAEIIPADTVLLAAGMKPYNPLSELNGFDGQIIMVGDVNGVADAAVATEDAYLKLRTL
jgi:2,4-dienoyl-CoA reductase (NADPH2)